MTSKFIPIAYFLSKFRSPFDQGWTLRIQTRLRQSSVDSLSRAMYEDHDPNVWRVAESLATKAELLRLISSRLVNSWDAVERELMSKGDEIDRIIESGRGKSRAGVELNQDAVLSMLVDFDAFVFEARSLMDYLARFLARFHSSIAAQSKTNKDGHSIIESLVSEPVGKEPWGTAVRNLRNLLIHEQSTWLDIELRCSESSDRQYAPVFILKGLTMGDPDAEGITGDQIAALARGLLSIGPKVEEHLVSAIADIEAAAQGRQLGR